MGELSRCNDTARVRLPDEYGKQSGRLQNEASPPNTPIPYMPVRLRPTAPIVGIKQSSGRLASAKMAHDGACSSRSLDLRS